MASLNEKLTAVLQAEFDGAEVQWDPASPAGKVVGFLVWSGFQGIEHIKRQNRLWKVLRKNLSPQEQLKISAILAFTPEEWTVSQEA